MSAKIPMSYNQIDAMGLHDILEQYRDKNHREIISDFENAVKSKSGVEHAVALNSGTAALHLALKVLEVGPGDHVIVSTFTYIASVSPIVYCGAHPVFIDSEETTWNMDPDLLEQALSDLAMQGKQVKAIVVIHTYGMPAQMDRILPIARRWQIPVIEDAAESFGATIDDKWTGTLGDIGIYSFNSNKSVTTFGGGALVTGHANQALQVRKLSVHSREDKPYYEHLEIGYNYAMGPLNAAYGLLELSRSAGHIIDRTKQFMAYTDRLGGLVQYQKGLSNMKSSRWLTTVKFSDGKSKIIDHLMDNRYYEMRRVWRPMHIQPVFRDSPKYLNGTAEDLFLKGICLPSGTQLSGKDIDRMASIFN